jgi:hypothetical protein
MVVSSKITDKAYIRKINNLPFDVQQSININAVKYRKLQKELYKKGDPYKTVFTLVLKDQKTKSFHNYGVRVFHKLNILEWHTLLFAQVLGFTLEQVEALMGKQTPIKIN